MSADRGRSPSPHRCAACDMECDVRERVEAIAANLEAGKPVWFTRENIASQLRAALSPVGSVPETEQPE